MNDERKAPETPPEYLPETTGTRWLPVNDVEKLIGKKERNARYWLERHSIPSRGDRPKLFSEQAIRDKLAELGQTRRKAPERIPEPTGIPPEYPAEIAGTYSEPIEAAYRVAGEAAEVALVPLATMVEELRGLADQLAELARRNEGLALEVGTLRERQVGHEAERLAHVGEITTREQAIGTQAETIAELRRRAEQAEAARDRLAAAQAAPAAPGAQEAATLDDPRAAPSQGFWARVRRVFGYKHR